MNYIFWLKQQAIAFPFIVLSSATTYGIVCYFGSGKPIILTTERIVFLVSYSLSYIFLVPFMIMRNSPKK